MCPNNSEYLRGKETLEAFTSRCGVVSMRLIIDLKKGTIQMIKAKFIRINRKSERIAHSLDATFVKTFNNIEEYAKFVSDCYDSAALMYDNLSESSKRVFVKKAFSLVSKRESKRENELTHI